MPAYDALVNSSFCHLICSPRRSAAFFFAAGLLIMKDMKKWIYRILMLACLCVFAYCAYRLYDIYSGSRQVEKETETMQEHAVKENTETQQKYLEPDWAALKEENPDIVGWLYVPQLGFSYPVVQGSDNSYYLTHTYTGADNHRGAIFLDSGAPDDFSGNNSIVYGHSVDVGGMFTDLDKYEDKGFFDANPYFYLLTPQGNYRADIRTFAKTIEGTSFYQSDFGDYRTEIEQQMMEEATYSRQVDPAGRPMITLSTCDLDYGFDSINRLALTAVLEPWNEPVALAD